MTRAADHVQIQTLLGSYALDAVGVQEMENVERHLSECAPCRDEAVACLEMAGALAGGYQPAPAPLWDRIAANLDDPPRVRATNAYDDRDHGRRPRRPHDGRRRGRVAVAVASIAAVAVAALGVTRVVEQNHRMARTQTALEDRTMLAAALAAQGDPRARRSDLRSGDGKVLAHAVLTPDGSGYVWSDGLPALAPARTYQLWAVIGDEPISTGLLGPVPRVAPFRASGDVVGLAITEETAGGVVASGSQPVVSGLVQEA